MSEPGFDPAEWAPPESPRPRRPRWLMVVVGGLALVLIGLTAVVVIGGGFDLLRPAGSSTQPPPWPTPWAPAETTSRGRGPGPVVSQGEPTLPGTDFELFARDDITVYRILGEAMMWEPLRAVGMPDRDLDADGVLAGIASLVAAGVADPDRLYLYGFSAGGYLVNRIVTRPHPFTAAASWESTADVRIFDGETHQLQVFFHGCELSECPDQWDAVSPITRPEKVTIPLTIICGGSPTTHRVASTAWHSALTEIGVASDLHIYLNQDHVFTPDAHRSALAVLGAGWNLT